MLSEKNRILTALSLTLVFTMVFLFTANDATAFVRILSYITNAMGTGAGIYGVTDIRWPIDAIDYDGDFDIDPDDEGMEITFEDGTLGFTDTQIGAIEEGYNAWEDILDCYVAFRTIGTTSSFGVDALPGLDGMNLMSIVFPGEPDPIGFGEGVLGVTIIYSYRAENYPFVQPYLYPYIRGTVGDILESDIIFNGAFIWSTDGETPGSYDLRAVATHEFGHFIGLHHSPLVVEQDGIARKGTAVMYPYAFQLDETDVTYTSQRYLQPDDIAGACSLYPREGYAESVASISGMATAPLPPIKGVPGIPIFGANVVALQDRDGNPLTVPIPYISALTGADTGYVGSGAGRFIIEGLDPAYQYSLKIVPLNGVDSVGVTAANFSGPLAGPFYFDFPVSYYTSDGVVVGNDDKFGENITVTADLVTTTSDSGSQIIFGNVSSVPDDTLPSDGNGGGGGGCFIATAAFGTPFEGKVILLKSFRDDTLLLTGFGRLFTRTYYTISPPLANFISSHETTAALTRAVLLPFIFAVKLLNSYLILYIAISFIVILVIIRAKRQQIVLNR